MARQMVAAGLFLGLTLLPASASASVFSLFTPTAQADTSTSTGAADADNSQTMSLGAASIGPSALSSDAAASTPDDVVISDAALTPTMGPTGNVTAANQTPDAGGYITTYTVRAGDTIASVADMFNVTPATVMWANDLTAKTPLKAGTDLTIPPVSGRIITIQKGDTLTSLSKKYGVPAGDIAYANDISTDQVFMPGDILVSPDDTLDAPAAKPTAQTSAGKVAPASTQKPSAGNYFIYPLPLAVSHWVQGLHANCGCAVDIGAPTGTPIYAVADGTVTKVTTSGYNEGWGLYVVIKHTLPNGLTATTLSAHMSRVVATVGETVHAGDVIGYVGTTGLTTGPHLHIEVTGVANPFNNPKYGR